MFESSHVSFHFAASVQIARSPVGLTPTLFDACFHGEITARLRDMSGSCTPDGKHHPCRLGHKPLMLMMLSLLWGSPPPQGQSQLMLMMFVFGGPTPEGSRR